MSISIDLATLRAQSRLFSLLNEAGQKQLLEGATEQRLTNGHVLMQEGDRGDAFFVIVDGKVRVSIEDKGSFKEVAALSRGAFVGEIAALMREARNATVVCDGDVTVLRFEAPRVNEVLKAYPRVREALVKLALKRSEDNLQRMLDFSEPDGAPADPDDEG